MNIKHEGIFLVVRKYSFSKVCNISNIYVVFHKVLHSLICYNLLFMILFVCTCKDNFSLGALCYSDNILAFSPHRGVNKDHSKPYDSLSAM